MPAETWTVAIDGGQLKGEHDVDQVRALIARDPDRHIVVWNESMPEWADPRTLRPFKAPPPPLPPPPAPAVPPSAAAKGVPLPGSTSGQAPVGTAEMKACSFCGEAILAVAVKCKHCGSDLTGQGQSPPKSAVANATSGPSEAIGGLLLGIPLVATLLMWFWIPTIPMIQGPGSSLTLIGWATIAGTAILAAVEASRLKTGDRNNEVNKGSRATGPAGWLIAHFFIWIIAYPAYVFKRSRYGTRNMVVGAVLIAVAFAGTWYLMGSLIDAKVEEIRSHFNRF